MRFIIPSHSPACAEASAGRQQVNSILSTMCLCKSSIFWPLTSSSSAALPNTRTDLHFSHFQIGITLAQNRCREIDQSRAPSSHLPHLPHFMCSGDQLIGFALSRSASFFSSIFTNHDEVA